MIAHIAGEINIKHIAPRTVFDWTRVNLCHINMITGKNIKHAIERPGDVGNMEGNFDTVVFRAAGQRAADGNKAGFVVLDIVNAFCKDIKPV